MKCSRYAAFAAALLMSTSLWSCSLFPEEEEVLAPPLTAPQAVTYRTHVVGRDTLIDSVIINGTFVSCESYQLSFEKRAGYLSEIAVEVGDTVEAGQVLARLDSDSLEKNVARQKLIVERAAIALEAAKNSPNATSSSIRLAEIDYQLQKLTLDDYETELSKQVIYAPADGMISYLAKQSVGDYVSARSTLMTLVDPDALQIQCTGDEIHQFELGQEVIVTMEKVDYKGKIVVTPSSMPYEMQQEGKSYLRIDMIDELPEGNYLGKTATVKLIRQQKDDILVVPRNVVTLYGGESYVQVLEDGVKTERVIQTGIKNSTAIEVISGLEEGEEVIIG